jgi:outer membrane protein OmpU
MRKLLLTSSALVAAASISSYAVADVSVTGGFEWKYTQQAADVTSKDGDSFHTDNEVVIKFTNKTDTGLTVSGKVELDVDTTNPGGGGTTVNDESVLSISGGFGTFRLGQEDPIDETFGIDEQDLIDEEGNGLGTSATLGNTSNLGLAGDANKIAYVTPNMGGFQAGYSIADSGDNETTDTNAIGASYTMPIGGGSMVVKYNQATKDGSTDTDTTNMGVQLNLGAMTLIASSGTKEIASDEDIEGNGFGIKYDMGGGMTVAAATVEVTDETDKSGTEEEKYTANIGEVVYTVASGLKAKVTYTDYEYKDGGSTSGTDDSGQITNLTISASF